MPLVSAMTVIVIAAAFGSRANRSVMSSRAAVGTDRLFRNGHQPALNTPQQCGFFFLMKTKSNCSFDVLFYLSTMKAEGKVF